MKEPSRGDAQYMEGGGSTAAAEQRDAFVSRRRPDGENVHNDWNGGLVQSLPTLRDRPMRWLLLFAAALQVFAWSLSNGYQLADSVEFMDRAHAVANGVELDATGAVRGFGFSTLLLPFFAIAKWLDVENMRMVVNAVRVLQMALGLGLVTYCTKLGARLGGRDVGYVAGYFVAINPVFLQYSTDPVSGIAAAFFLAFSLNILIVRRGFWRALGGGLILGAAFIMAYQTILVAVPLILLLFLRDRLNFIRSWSGAAAGMMIAIAGQIVLDKIMYGTWGISIRTYLIENTGGVTFTFLSFLGLGETSLQSAYFYLLELPAMLVYPLMLAGVLGLLRAWRQMNWKSSILVLLFLINAYAMSLKGSKSFRLWLPLLPMLAPICAWGWGALVRAGELERPGIWRRALGVVILVGGLFLGMRAIEQLNTRRYGAYWSAMDFVSAQAAAERRALAVSGKESDVAKVGAAYNWAVFCRGGPDVEIVKFQNHLDQWHALSQEQRGVVIEQLRELDWLVLHGTIFPLSADLTSAINKGFEVVASLWDENTDPTIRDIRVLRRLPPPGEERPLPPGHRAKRLWEVVENADPEEYRREWELDRRMPRAALFVGQGLEQRPERLKLLGFEYELLPEEDFGWITYHWYTDTGFDRDYVLVDRISTLECPWAWQNNRIPGHGALPTSKWMPGWIVRESYLVVPGIHAFTPEFKAIGGSFRRGDLLPAQMWVRGESPPPNINEHKLLPAHPLTAEPFDVNLGSPWSGYGLRMPDGHILSRDELALVSRFLLPVNPRFAWPDDGRPGPDERELRAAHDRQERLLEKLRKAKEAEDAAAGRSSAGTSQVPAPTESQ